MKKLLLFHICIFNFISLSAQTWVTEGAPNTQGIKRLFANSKGVLYSRPDNYYFRKPVGGTWTEMRVENEQMGSGNCIIDNDTLYYLKIEGYSGDVSVHMSTNDGETWSKLSASPLFPSYISEPGFFRIKGVCFASENRNVYRSSDNGNTWHKVYTLPFSEVQSFVFFDNRILFGTGSNFVFASSDLGLTWTQIKNQMPSGFTYGLVNSGTYAAVSTYNGIAILAPGSTTWEKRSNGLPNVTADLCIAASGDTMFASFDRKTYASYDAGKNWTMLNVPGQPNSTLVRSLLLQGRSLWVGGGSGVHLSDRSTLQFKSENKGFPASKNGIYNVAMYNDSLFLGTAAGLFKRQKSQVMDWYYTGKDISDQCFGIYNFNQTLFAISPDGILKSNNGGASWFTESLGFVSASRLVYNGQTIFAGTNNGVLRSTNMGQTWTEANGGKDHSNSALHVSGNNLYALDNLGSANPGVWYSNDNGTTYTNIKGNLPETKYLNITELGGKAFIALGSGKVYSAPAGTSNWTLVDVSPNTTDIFSDKGLLCVAGYEGFFYSTDQGNTWNNLNTGLPNEFLKFSIIHNDTLYATTTQNALILKLPINNLLSTGSEVQLASRVSVYPNPSNGQLIIEAVTAQSELNLYNNAGELVQSYPLKSGQTKLDLQDLPEGLYFYSIAGQNSSQKGKLVLHKR